MSGDTELLRRYVEERSDAAFAELVRLHLNLVYLAALRQIGGDVHRAQEVAQAVFTDLARKAHTLTDRATLTGWLHTSTRFAAAKMRRAEFSRQRYEREATTMNALLHEPDPTAEWDRLRPMIDDAIHELDERDREAVLLRFFENRPFAEIGATLHLSDDAARMRVERALDKLRSALARRGVKSTNAALAVVFANQVTAAAPAGLATSISGTALAEVAAGTGFFMSTTTAILSTVALAAIGSTAYQWNLAFRAESELAALTADRDGLRAQLGTEQQRSAQDVAALKSELAALRARPMTQASPAAQKAALPQATMVAVDDVEKLRRESQHKAIVNNLRAIASARDQFQMENGRLPTSLDELVAHNRIFNKLVPVDGENYTNVSLIPGQPLVTVTSDGTAIRYDQAAMTPPTAADKHLAELRQKIGPAAARAMEAYRAANNGMTPTNPSALIPYFATAGAGADFVEFIDAQKTTNK